ncbi:hypothetical protein Esti_001774 [Eimeria stiedai]
MGKRKRQNTAEAQIGNRVVSGLAVDDSGRQYQARGPTATLGPVPGVAPLCETYNNPAMSAQDWENPVAWRSILELGISRLTPAAIEPRKQQVHTPRSTMTICLLVFKPLTLLLNGHECNVARVTAFIRLGSESGGGIIFRAKSLTDYVAAILDTQTRVAKLEVCKGGLVSTITEAPVFYLNPSIRHKLVVHDHGQRGLVQMQVDDSELISHQMHSTGVERDCAFRRFRRRAVMSILVRVGTCGSLPDCEQKKARGCF